MKEITVTGRKLEFGPGAVLKLTPAQAKSRIHNLLTTGRRDEFEVVNLVEFKVGETLLAEIGTGGVTEKFLATRTIEVERERAEAEKRAARLGPTKAKPGKAKRQPVAGTPQNRTGPSGESANGG